MSYRRAALTVLAVVAVAAATAAHAQLLPTPPVIGIFTNGNSWAGSPTPPAGIKTNSWVESYYVRWLEAAGVRVIPFPWNATEARQLHLARRVNGILFPGGGLDGPELDDYVTKVRRVLGWATEWAARGDPFFVWGTCQGFQVLAAAAGHNASLIEGPYHGMYPLMMPLNFTAAQQHSRMFGVATTPLAVLRALRTRPTTLNWHHEIINVKSFAANAALRSTFTPLSVNNVPGTDTVFVSSYEARGGANVFATQFHPERPPYSFSNIKVGHDAAAISVSQYLSDFVAARLRLNKHAFATPAELEAMVVENFPVQYVGWGSEVFWVWDQNE